MTKSEYLSNVENMTINQERIKEISVKYSVGIRNDLIAKVISYAGQVTFFDEERRALDYSEIIGASKEYEIDFVKLGIIPFVDAFDLTFVVYIIKDDKWGRFSIVDQSVYMVEDKLEEVL